MSFTFFTLWGSPVTSLEFVAAIISFIGVWLGTTRKRITWPWWALSSALYGVFFYQVDLFASAALQLVFITAAVYGWFGWAPTGAVASSISTRHRRYIAIGTIISVAALSPVLSSIGAAATWSDAFLLIGSFVAQVMMVYQKWEAWVVWLIVDLAGTVQYAMLGYWFTTVLYAMFTVVALIGWKRWHDSLSH